MSEPLVSVVIASVNGLPALTECLDALVRQEGGVSAELLVVDRCGEATRAEVRRRFPAVRIVEADPRASIPALRAMGFAQARGRMIAILEDHCNACPGWLQAIERAHRDGRLVIGGAVENGSVERTLDWAVFFCEYAPFMPPIPRGSVAAITGNNSVYDRATLERLGLAAGEVWETFLHERLRAAGIAFYSEPDLLVSHKKTFGYRYFLSQRYHYSRSFAAMRLISAPPWKRLAYACGSVLLPGLLSMRLATTVLRKRCQLARFLEASPAILTFLVAWAWGEAVGALLGPGDSLRRVE